MSLLLLIVVIPPKTCCDVDFPIGIGHLYVDPKKYYRMKK